MPGKMHADEVETNRSLVRRLLADQFPQWADLTIDPLESSGTDNAIYRLGEDMAVRLPRIPGGTGTIETELRWLPKLAPLLPVDISLHRWLDGESVNVERMADSVGLAQDLGGFVAALRRIDTTGGPIAGRDGSRGVPLARRAEGREAFRSVIEVDDATWTRGRGWALSFTLIALPYYTHTNPVFVRDARHVIREVLAPA